MKLLIFSDSHGDFLNMEKAAKRHPDADYLLFLGDGLSDAEGLSLSCSATFLGVRGNCDFERSPYDLERRCDRLLQVEGHTLLLTHGDRYGARAGIGGLAAEGKRQGADVVLFGHTHLPYESYLSDGGIYLFNPGSIGRPPDGVPTYGLLTVSGEHLLFSHGRVEH